MRRSLYWRLTNSLDDYLILSPTMIVPAVPQYLNENDVAALRPGEVHHVDSGLGGSFRLRFAGHEGDHFVFENISDGWQSHGPYRYTYDEVRQQVYDLVAENPAFRAGGR